MCFGVDQKTKMAALASDWLSHFRLLLKLLNASLRNLTGSKYWKFSTKYQYVCFSCRLEDKDGCLLIYWDSFDFSSATARNFTKLYRSQVLNILYKVSFGGPSVIKHGLPGLWLVETCALFPQQSVNGIWQKSWMLSPTMDFFGADTSTMVTNGTHVHVEIKTLLFEICFSESLCNRCIVILKILWRRIR